MEITTCEQYVLAKLQDLELEKELLERSVMSQRSIIESLRAEIESMRDDPITKAALKRFFEDYTYLRSTQAIRDDGTEVPFDEWRRDVVRAYALPTLVTEERFLERFDDELRKAYAQILEEDREICGDGSDD